MTIKHWLNDWLFYRIQNKKICQRIWIFAICKKFIWEIWGTFFRYHYKTGLDNVKTASKKVVHKTAEASRELIGNKITENIVKPKTAPNENSRNVDKIVIPPEKRQEILNESRQVL